MHGAVGLGCFTGADCRRRNVFAQARPRRRLTYMGGSVGMLWLIVEIEI